MTFLTAEDSAISILVNWEVPDELLLAYLLPRAAWSWTLWQSKSFLSLVGFRFLNTRLLNVPVPFHVNFEEVNLRFYGETFL